MGHESNYSTGPLSRGHTDVRISGTTAVLATAAYCSRHPTPKRAWGFLCSVRLLPQGYHPTIYSIRPPGCPGSHQRPRAKEPPDPGPGAAPRVSPTTGPGTRHLCVTFLRASKGTPGGPSITSLKLLFRRFNYGNKRVTGRKSGKCRGLSN